MVTAVFVGRPVAASTASVALVYGCSRSPSTYRLLDVNMPRAPAMPSYVQSASLVPLVESLNKSGRTAQVVVRVGQHPARCVDGALQPTELVECGRHGSLVRILDQVLPALDVVAVLPDGLHRVGDRRQLTLGVVAVGRAVVVVALGLTAVVLADLRGAAQRI